MAISIFPSTAAEFVSNNFVVDMNDTSNNTVTLQNIKQAGTYNISIESGDTTFDIYLLDSDGSLVAYTNSTTVAAPGLFQIVVILGVSNSEVVSFSYAGTVNNTDSQGDQPGAGAYLTSVSPADLPGIDDTATVIGGNFGAATEITFESGTVSLPAKNITVTNGTSLIVTRPDGLVEDNAPYDLKAINAGVTPPSSVDFILAGTITAGSDPTWVTTSPLNSAAPGVSFTQTLEATDSDGTVVDYSVTAGTITPGLSLNSSTGVLSGTPTTGGTYTFTVTATDDGGNETAKEFDQAVQLASGGTVTDDGGFRYHTFTSTDDFEVFAELTDAEYLVVAGGGGGGVVIDDGTGFPFAGGGGGAGGLTFATATVSPGTQTVTIGAGGAVGSNGSSTSLGALATATGGGRGGAYNQRDGAAGGSGGGAGAGDGTSGTGGSGTAGQGFDGGDTSSSFAYAGAGGGGASEVGSNTTSGLNGSDGGDGALYSTFATATSTGDSGYYAGGGSGGGLTSPGTPGLGGGGTGGQRNGSSVAAVANTGGGGGAGYSDNDGGLQVGTSGASGIVIVRYAF